MINASGEIRSQVADGVATFVISRPERRNALTSRLYRDLARSLILAGEDPTIRVILLKGDGDAFIGANDIDELIANQPVLMDSEDFLAMPLVADLDAPVFAFLRALVESAKPIVAAVDGPAIGLGTAILLHCCRTQPGR